MSAVRMPYAQHYGFLHQLIWAEKLMSKTDKRSGKHTGSVCATTIHAWKWTKEKEYKTLTMLTLVLRRLLDPDVFRELQKTTTTKKRKTDFRLDACEMSEYLWVISELFYISIGLVFQFLWYRKVKDPAEPWVCAALPTKRQRGFNGTVSKSGCNQL